jgi:hypothetical protein
MLSQSSHMCYAQIYHVKFEVLMAATMKYAVS